MTPTGLSHRAETKGMLHEDRLAVSRAVSSVQDEAELLQLFRDLEPGQKTELLRLAKRLNGSCSDKG
ncbi:MAG: hypothetical protein Rhob2KO_14630 [Rhodopirellula baltica]